MSLLATCRGMCLSGGGQLGSVTMTTAAATTTVHWSPLSGDEATTHFHYNTTFLISGKTGGQSAKCNFSSVEGLITYSKAQPSFLLACAVC